MLPQENRLRLERDINTLFAHGKSVFGTGLGMKFHSNRRPQSRFAVVVGTKVSKKAVERNRLKRQIRAIIYERLSDIAPGYDVVFFAKKGALGKSFHELSEHVMRALKTAKLL